MAAPQTSRWTAQPARCRLRPLRDGRDGRSPDPARPAGPGGGLHPHRTGVDLLVGPGLFGRAWPRLCAGYVADAIGREPKSWQWLDAGSVLPALARGRVEPAPAVGLGEEYRLGTAGLAGAALVAHGRVAHPAAEAPEVYQ